MNADHLARLKHLCGWLNPASFSEHLAWSTHEGEFLNDLLPLPYTARTLACVADHVDQVQSVVGRRMLLENPSVYVDFTESDMDEIDFLTEIARRTCALPVEPGQLDDWEGSLTATRIRSASRRRSLAR